MGAEWNLRDRDLGEVGKDSFITLQELQETQFWSLGPEDPLEEEVATHSSIFAWRIPMDRGTCWAIVNAVTKSRTQLSAYTHTHTYIKLTEPKKQFKVEDKTHMPIPVR